MRADRAALDDQLVERLVAGRSGPDEQELQRAVGLMRSMGSGPAPRPTTALAALLDTGFEPATEPPRRPAVRRRWTARVSASVAAAAASLLLAGTAQALPAPLQDGVAGVVGALTPFELPGSRADDGSSAPQNPSPGAGTTSEEPAPTPVPSAPGAAADHGVGTDGGRGDGEPGRPTAIPGAGSTQRSVPPGADRQERATSGTPQPGGDGNRGVGGRPADVAPQQGPQPTDPAGRGASGAGPATTGRAAGPDETSGAESSFSPGRR